MEREPRRVARKRPASAQKPVYALAAGDSVEFSLTAEIKTQSGRVMWAKAGVTTTVWEGEAPSDAQSRAQDLVVEFVEQAAKDLG